jgi:hypothetical protein
MRRWTVILLLLVMVQLVSSQQTPAQQTMQQKNHAPRQAAPEFHIDGAVVDSRTGQPLAHTRVAIAPVTQRDDFTTIVTGEDGHFVFSHLAAGKYTLIAQRRGYLTQAFNQHEQFSSSIAVGPELDSSNLVFRLPSESVISGIVTDDQGDPVQNAQVTLFQNSLANGTRSTHRRSGTVSDDEGSYHFAHLPAGRYFISVSAEPWYAQPDLGQTIASLSDGVAVGASYSGPPAGIAGANPPPPVPQPPSPLDVAYPLTFYSGATDAASATAINLEEGQKASADIVMHAERAMHIRVPINNAGQDQNFYAVLQERTFDSAVTNLQTRSVQVAPGILEIAGSVPGHYVMKINSWKDGQQQVMEQEGEVSDNGEIDTSGATANVTVNAVIQMDTPARSLEKSQLLLRNKKTNEFVSAQPNEKGEVEFKTGVSPGTYEVFLQGTQDIFIKNLSATGAKLVGRILEIKSSAVKLNLVAGQGRGVIHGVALRDGKPMAGAMVVLVPADPANNQVLFRRDQSDSDGSFTLPAVVPGKYTVLAIADGWDLEWANPEVLKKYMAQGEAVIVEPRGKYSIKTTVQ